MDFTNQNHFPIFMTFMLLLCFFFLIIFIRLNQACKDSSENKWKILSKILLNNKKQIWNILNFNLIKHFHLFIKNFFHCRKLFFAICPEERVFATPNSYFYLRFFSYNNVTNIKFIFCTLPDMYQFMKLL